MIIYLLIFVLGVFAYPIVISVINQIFPYTKGGNKSSREPYKEAVEKIEDIKKIVKNKKYHLEPKYYAYGGGYDIITKCDNCLMIGLYEDQHPVKPCHFCGGKVESYGSGKWMEVDGQMQWNKKFNKDG